MRTCAPHWAHRCRQKTPPSKSSGNSTFGQIWAFGCACPDTADALISPRTVRRPATHCHGARTRLGQADPINRSAKWPKPCSSGQSAGRVCKACGFDPISEAYQALQDGDPETARLFENSQWRGSAHYRSGDFSGAVNDFMKDSSQAGLYNQGNALAQLVVIPKPLNATSRCLTKIRSSRMRPAARLCWKNCEQQNQQAEQEQQDRQQQQQSQQSQSSDSDPQQEQGEEEEEQQQSKQQPEQSERRSDEENAEEAEAESDTERDEKQEALEQWLRQCGRSTAVASSSTKPNNGCARVITAIGKTSRFGDAGGRQYLIQLKVLDRLADAERPAAARPRSGRTESCAG